MRVVVLNFRLVGVDARRSVQCAPGSGDPGRSGPRSRVL